MKRILPFVYLLVVFAVVAMLGTILGRLAEVTEDPLLAKLRELINNDVDNRGPT